MHAAIEIRLPLDPTLRVRRLGVYLGSFDPPHRGHRFVVDTLLARCDAVLVLVPATHFHKAIRPLHNASLDQRVQMLSPWHRRARGRLAVGVAHEVLFLRLDAALQRVFPAVEIVFALGDEALARLQDSRRYFRAQGLPWGPAEQCALAALLPRCRVFARHRHQPGWIAVPAALQAISSTRVRERVACLRAAGAQLRAQDLADLVEPELGRFLANSGLYPPGASSRAA